MTDLGLLYRIYVCIKAIYFICKFVILETYSNQWHNPTQIHSTSPSRMVIMSNQNQSNSHICSCR